MNEYIKKKILDKKIACKFFNTNIKNYDFYMKPQTISTELSEMVLKRKNDYHRQLSDKLNDPETLVKAFWYILKILYNGKKIPLVHPILVNNKHISNFKEKANYLNDFLHLNVLQFLMIVLYPFHKIQFVMLVYHPFISKIWIFLRLYAPLTTSKFLVMMIYIYKIIKDM